jgi:hypothetical protein
LIEIDVISDTSALDLWNADLDIPFVVIGRGDEGETGEGDNGGIGESRLEKNSVASDGDRACVARIRGLGGRPTAVPGPSLGLGPMPDPKLGAALSRVGVTAALEERMDCNDGVISILPPPITVRLVSFALSRFIACVSVLELEDAPVVVFDTGGRIREPVS